MRRNFLVVLLTFCLMLTSYTGIQAAESWDGPGQYMTRVSTDSSGNEANNQSYYELSISADGRFVAFWSNASNLVNNDTNEVSDIFRKDLQTGEIIRVSNDLDGNESNNNSYYPSISADGRFISFVSDSTNLVSNDTNGTWDVFRKDIMTGEVIRATTSSDGNESIGESRGFYSLTSISGSGRFVAFVSSASNLVSNDLNHKSDVFWKDLQTGETVRVSTDSSGNESNDGSTDDQLSINFDGRYVAFSSFASNLVENDTNDSSDIFRKDLQTGEIIRVSTASDGSQAINVSYSPSMTPDGNYIVFESFASNLVENDNNGSWDIFRKNLISNDTIRISVNSTGEETIGGAGWGRPDSRYATISTDGRYVSFTSYAENLIQNDTNNKLDIFRKDIISGQVFRVSVNSQGVEANNSSPNRAPQINSDGRYVAFSSFASNLISDDMNNENDIFLADMSLYPSTVDVTPPQINIVSPESRDYLISENLTVSYSVTDDNSGVNSVTSSINGTTNGYSQSVTNGQIVDLFTMPIGNYIFTVTASDVAGNLATSQISFSVIATSSSLSTVVSDIIASNPEIPNGTENSLTSTLDAAQSAINSGNNVAAINELEAFIHKLESNGTGLDAETRAALIYAARAIINGL